MNSFTPKTKTNFNDEIVQLTDLEGKAIEALLNGDEYDERHYRHIDDLSRYAKVDNKQIRGVVASLVKKSLVLVETDFFRKGDSIVFYIGHK